MTKKEKFLYIMVNNGATYIQYKKVELCQKGMIF